MKVKVYVRPVEGKGNFKGYANAVVNGITIKDLTIKDGKYGLYVEMPNVYVESKNQYTSLISGVNKELREALATACKEALENPQHEASVGDKAEKMHYSVHYHAMNHESLRGMASLTIREEGSEKSMMTIQNIRIINNKDKEGFVISMPSKRYEKDGKTNYSEVVKYNDNDRKFINGLIAGEVNKELKKNKNLEPSYLVSEEPAQDVPQAQKEDLQR